MTYDPFGAYKPEAPRYKGMVASSHYLTMRDGVQLAAEVWLPTGMAPGDRLPTILTQTRYWRAIELRQPWARLIQPDWLNLPWRKYKPFFTSHGYALVTVDVRGTGASLGVFPHPWHKETIADASEIVDWIVSQRWSNGKVAGSGGSYMGTTAELLAVPKHPAVTAILAQFNHPDAYTDIAFPGGIFNQRFILDWGMMDKQLDTNEIPQEMGGAARLLVKGVKPVGNDRDGRLLQAAMVAHQGNTDIFARAHETVFRDDIYPDADASMDGVVVHRYADEIAEASVPIGGWASWMDAGTADAALRRFMTFENAGWAVIGAWEHGCTRQASPYVAPGGRTSPTLRRQWSETMRFFDAFLKNADNGVRWQRTLHYYTMGEETWKTTHAFPIPGTVTARWYFDENNSLSQDTPTAGQCGDTYTVDFTASTGLRNRWWEFSGTKNDTVVYANRAEAGRHLLTYTTPPLPHDTEITGYPVVSLYVTSSENDGAFYVYLEDVAPNGRVTYITEGQLRAIHRKVSTDPSPYKLVVPYHSFKRQDAMPLAPGQVAELTFGLLPTSVLVRAGHRLRVGIAGHDEGTFLRIPASGTPVIRVSRNKVHASRIDLPTVPRL
jgi:uncharacterized protein